MGIQCATNRQEVIELVTSIHHHETLQEVLTERSFLEKYGGGCHVAAGCIAQMIESGHIEATAMIENNEGDVIRATQIGADPIILGQKLADQLLQAK